MAEGLLNCMVQGVVRGWSCHDVNVRYIITMALEPPWRSFIKKDMLIQQIYNSVKTTKYYI